MNENQKMQKERALEEAMHHHQHSAVDGMRQKVVERMSPKDTMRGNRYERDMEEGQ